MKQMTKVTKDIPTPCSSLVSIISFCRMEDCHTKISILLIIVYRLLAEVYQVGQMEKKGN